MIDIFSRYGWVEPLKDKTANEIVKAFDKVLQEGRIPKRLRSDSAKDFTSEKFQKYVKSKKITHFVTHTEKQANYVERFIKTLKSKIFKYMVEKNSARYIDVLPKIVQSYNRTWHSGIRSEPICCDMGQNDTIGKIELNPSIVLSSDNTNCKNDIQLFHQLFDELSVYRDYH